MLERLPASVGGLRQLLQGLFLLALVAWVLDLPGRLGLAVYTEQYLALAAGLAIALALLAPAAAPRGPAAELANLGFAVLILAAFLRAAVLYPELERQLASAPAPAVLQAVVMIAGIIEAVRRRTGWFLPLLLAVLVFIALVVGPELPSSLATRPVSPERLAVYLALDTNALLSRLLHVAVVTIAPFILFGALLNGFGIGLVLTRHMVRLAGGATAGTAKASVLGSAGFGLVSGSAVANVTTVGAVSIPMMRRAGYQPHEAAAIESVASTGGQLLPPLMGAAAFLMAEFLELPYRDVAIAAALPGLLFYAALFMAVDFDARRRGETRPLHPASASAGGLGPAQPWRYLIAVAVLLHLLFVEGRSPQHAGLVATGALIVCHLCWPLDGFVDRVRETWRQTLDATTTMADIVILAAAAALVVGVLGITGLAFALTLQMVTLSGGLLLALLLLSAALSMILGMGMPTVAVYVLLSTLAAPALVQLGTEPIAAHMFLLYFGMLSMITPPIAIASFAAASVAAADPWRTAFKAVRLSAAVYVIPFAFVGQPALLLVGGDLPATLLALLRCLVAMALVTAGTVGGIARRSGWPVRLLALVLAVPNLVAFGGRVPDAALLASLVAGLVLLGLMARGPDAAGHRIAH
jgi:TRAP transporter 4TM/12TM fusion protein